jgi:hypothetical protein
VLWPFLYTQWQAFRGVMSSSMRTAVLTMNASGRAPAAF